MSISHEPSAIRCSYSRFRRSRGGVEVLLTAGLIFLLTYRSRQSLERQNEQLNALQGERSVLHRVFRHNLRQDINVIMGCNELIQSQFDDDRVSEPCDQVLDRVARIERYQDKLRRFERLLEPPIPLDVTDLTELVTGSPRVRALQESDDISVDLDLPAESPVLATTHLSQAFHEVLKNAVTHNDADDPEIEISVGDATAGLVDLVVTDNGSGIPPYERRAINQMEEQQLTHSSGLGLWMVKLACTVSGGELVIPPQVDGGTVVLRLPEAAHRTLQRRLADVFR